jgi:AraC-like DNA-binding protein
VRERLSPEQRAAVEADPALARLFLALDLLGAKEAPRDAAAARIALVSRTTLWRRCLASLGCTYFEFVRAWRAAAAALLYRCGKGHVRQDVAAKRTGLGSRSRLRAAFLACTGLLPTGGAPRSLAHDAWRGPPLFAGSG